MQENDVVPDLSDLHLFIVNLVAHRINAYYDIAGNRYITKAMAEAIGQVHPNDRVRLFAPTTDEINVAARGITRVNKNFLYVLTAVNLVSKILSTEKYFPYARQTIVQRGEIPSGLDVDNFVYVVKYPGDDNKPYTIITDVEARALHDQDGIIEKLNNAGAGSNISMFDGLWFFALLSNERDRNSQLSKNKFFLVTTKSSWLEENQNKVIELTKAYVESRKGKAVLIDIPVPTTEEEIQPIIQQEKPKINYQPASAPATSSGKKKRKPIMKPARGEPSGKPKIQEQPESVSQFQTLKQKSLDEYANLIRNKHLDANQRNKLLQSISTAVLDEDKARLGIKDSDIKKTAKGSNVFNMTTYRLVLEKSAGNIIYDVNGYNLFRKNCKIRIAIPRTSPWISWNQPSKPNSEEFNKFVAQELSQAAFDILVETYFPSEIAFYSEQSSESKQLLNIDYEEYVKSLNEISETIDMAEEPQTFSVVFPPEENLGFPPHIIAMASAQQEFNVEPGKNLPNIRRQRPLTVLDINDTEKRAEVLAENIRKYQQMAGGGIKTTIDEIREERIKPVPADVTRDTKGFTVMSAVPTNPNYVKVDLRVPRRKNQTRGGEDVDLDAQD